MHEPNRQYDRGLAENSLMVPIQQSNASFARNKRALHRQENRDEKDVEHMESQICLVQVKSVSARFFCVHQDQDESPCIVIRLAGTVLKYIMISSHHDGMMIAKLTCSIT